MRRIYYAGAVAAPPSVPPAPSEGYPTIGNPGTNVPATTLGAFFIYMVSEGLISVIEQAGLVPNDSPTQFRDALLALFPDVAALASDAEHTQANPPDDKAATPSGVRAVRDALVGGAPGQLNVLDELAAAINDDPDFSATLMAAIALRARLDGAVFSGATQGLTRPANDSTTHFATTAFIAAAPRILAWATFSASPNNTGIVTLHGSYNVSGIEILNQWAIISFIVDLPSTYTVAMSGTAGGGASAQYQSRLAGSVQIRVGTYTISQEYTMACFG